MTFWRQFVDLSFQFELYQKMFNVILDSNSLRVRHLAISTIRTCASIVLLFSSIKILTTPFPFLSVAVLACICGVSFDRHSLQPWMAWLQHLCRWCQTFHFLNKLDFPNLEHLLCLCNHALLYRSPSKPKDAKETCSYEGQSSWTG